MQTVPWGPGPPHQRSHTMKIQTYLKDFHLKIHCYLECYTQTGPSMEMFSQVQPYRHVESLQLWPKEPGCIPTWQQNSSSTHGAVFTSMSIQDHKAIKAHTKVPGGKDLWSQTMVSRVTFLCGITDKAVHEAVKMKSELWWRPQGIGVFKNMGHLWRKVTGTKGGLPKSYIQWIAAPERQGPTRPLDGDTDNFRHQTRGFKYLLCCVLVFFWRIVLYYISFLPLGIRMFIVWHIILEVYNKLFWFFVVVLVIYFTCFLLNFTGAHSSKEILDLEFLIGAVKTMGAFEVGVEMFCILRWPWGYHL